MSVSEIDAIKNAILEILGWIAVFGVSVFMFLAIGGHWDEAGTQRTGARAANSDPGS